MRRWLAIFGVATLAAVVPARSAKTEAKVQANADYSAFGKKLPKDQEILQALDRLTFGPRPGDVEAVKKLGLKKWIDLQLHPERIPENPELLARLAPPESLRL